MNIIENILLTQDITSYITRLKNPTNTIIKLDITNAYDKTSLFFL